MPLDFATRTLARDILDTTPTNILTCDPTTFKIDYANKASIETLNKLAHLLPNGVRGDNIVGQNIDVFHKKPQHQRNLLSNDNIFPYSTIIRLGAEMLDLSVDAIRSGRSVKKLVLSWSVCTERERLKIMVDNMPINIMMASPEDFTINFVNQTSLDTLRQIEHLLPIKADEVQGTCIDRFHKTPEHQRRILADPNNLPHSAKINLGTETLQLDTAAILDKTGYYIGPMVSWSVITTQETLAKSVSSVSEVVSEKSGELQKAAGELSAAAQQSSSQATSVSAAAEEASVNVQTVASAAEELSSSIGEISRNVTTANEVANSAREKAETTNSVVGQLQEAANQISSVVSLINDIAEQTNLLALNATIEAARAGDAGKGFAVVASEVKDLAGQTASATDQIDQQINNMLDITKTAVDAITDISKSVDQICESSTAIAAAMEEQNATTDEIARNVTEAAAGTAEVSSSVSLVQAAANQTGSVAEQLLSLSNILSDNSEDMYNQVTEFLGGDNEKKK